MDWTNDEIGLSEDDRDKVFKYGQGESTIVQLLESNQFESEISSLRSDDHDKWREFFEEELPSIESNGDSGLILLITKRIGEPAIRGVSKVSSMDWERMVMQEVPKSNEKTRAGTFLPFLEHAGPVAPARPAPTTDVAQATALGGGGRGVRMLPFGSETFRRVTCSFHTHGSIARAISRSDVPVFSADMVEMAEQPAYVYNCRSSNAWDMDLALSVTYFPHRGLTFAILYGCPFTIEKDIIRRLSRVRAESVHPLLMPGIFAELERDRHMRLVRASVAKLETCIFELNVPTDRGGGDWWGQDEEAEQRNIAKRTAWLDTAYLRNGLESWGGTHLARMAQAAAELEGVVSASMATSRLEGDAVLRRGKHEEKLDVQLDAGAIAEVAGRKIQSRIATIRDEYADWIRDCTMRVEGMAMATQWAQGETNVEIAIATKRDSKHMRSIALLTMVFLPGTFLASVFSMTFFNWNDDGGSLVSKWIWIYVLMGLLVTFVTVFAWYYFVIWRSNRKRTQPDEEAGSEKGLEALLAARAETRDAVTESEGGVEIIER